MQCSTIRTRIRDRSTDDRSHDDAGSAAVDDDRLSAALVRRSAARLGVDLMFATDRCHALDDPWQDAAVPVRFHEEDASLRAIVRRRAAAAASTA